MSISAKGIHGYIGDNLIAGLYSAKFRESGGELDNCTAASEGYGNPEGSILEGTLTISGWYDVGLSAYVPIRARTVVEGVLLYATADETNPIVDMPFALATESEIGGEVRGKIDFSVTLKTKGAYIVAECVHAGLI